jgi:hypothetical protein
MKLSKINYNLKSRNNSVEEETEYNLQRRRDSVEEELRQVYRQLSKISSERYYFDESTNEEKCGEHDESYKELYEKRKLREQGADFAAEQRINELDKKAKQLRKKLLEIDMIEERMLEDYL